MVEQAQQKGLKDPEEPKGLGWCGTEMVRDSESDGAEGWQNDADDGEGQRW